MVRVAAERISDLFALAEKEAASGHGSLADRYVALARRIGMRYNVRLLAQYRELYCRGCSRFWIEGRTVRTRLRDGRRVRTCLNCGRRRRIALRPARPARRGAPWGTSSPVPQEESVLITPPSEEEREDLSDEDTEEA